MSKKEHDYDGMDNQGRFIPEKEHFHIRVWNTVDWIMKGILYSVLATGSLKDIEKPGNRDYNKIWSTCVIRVYRTLGIGHSLCDCPWLHLYMPLYPACSKLMFQIESVKTKIKLN